jgi:hypothetical protein
MLIVKGEKRRTKDKRRTPKPRAFPWKSRKNSLLKMKKYPNPGNIIEYMMHSVKSFLIFGIF